MTTRLIQGIPWRVVCPSHYELEAAPVVSITYLGDGSAGEGDQWFLHVPLENGEPRMDAYPSRDAAAAFIARALTQASA